MTQRFLSLIRIVIRKWLPKQVLSAVLNPFLSSVLGKILLQGMYIEAIGLFLAVFCCCLLACFLEKSHSFFLLMFAMEPLCSVCICICIYPCPSSSDCWRYLTCSQPHVLDLSVKNSPKCVNSCLNFMYQFFLTSLDDSWASLLFLSPEQLTVHLVLTREKIQFIWCSWKPESWFFNNILEFILKRLQTI